MLADWIYAIAFFVTAAATLITLLTNSMAATQNKGHLFLIGAGIR